MSSKNLPPLEVDTTYRARDFEYFEFSAQSLHHAMTGEETAILRLHLANKTKIDIPATETDLHFLMRVLMAAYPKVAMDYRNSLMHWHWMIDENGNATSVRFQARGELTTSKKPISVEDIRAKVDEARALVVTLSAFRDHHHKGN